MGKTIVFILLLSGLAVLGSGISVALSKVNMDSSDYLLVGLTLVLVGSSIGAILNGKDSKVETTVSKS